MDDRLGLGIGHGNLLLGLRLANPLLVEATRYRAAATFDQFFESPESEQAGHTFENDKDLYYADIPARYRTVTFSFRRRGLPKTIS